MKKHYLWLTIIVGLTAAAIFLYSQPVETPSSLPLPDQTDETNADLKKTETKKASVLAEIRHPIPPAPAPVAETQAAAVDTQQTSSPQAPLPAFEKSDGLILKTLSSLFETYPLHGLLRDANIISRIVVTVDNLPRKRISPAQFPTKPVDGTLMAKGEEGKQVLSHQNYGRYRIYVNMIETVDQKKLVNAYFYMYPLFQQAYDELGYQNAYFNDRLIETIDDLLKSPEILEPIKLTRTSVMFKFADPQLEILSAGQKTMIRMGPENSKRVKNALLSIRELLIASDTPEASKGDNSMNLPLE
ncbi:hypothetical protein MNBD_GAMMA09-2822 [hydrothermal vent metagenome]|uniref:DUF3014 domain-containing protein n=1 Tax=hydrothermal vent metagenome TaxID=652676 RepID=A0A3B0XEQ7_9ZZZZ